MTVATANSPLTRGTQGNVTRVSNISDLEASVARQQEEFKKLSLRLDKMDERNNQANEVYQKMGSFQIQLDQMFLALQRISENLDTKQERHHKRSHTKPPPSNKQHHDSCDGSMNSDANTVESNTTSPEKKRYRIKTTDSNTNTGHTDNMDPSSPFPITAQETQTQTDLTSAQYTPPCASDRMITE
jgi:hypothetical protein